MWRKSIVALSQQLLVDRKDLSDAIGEDWCRETVIDASPIELAYYPNIYLRRIDGSFDAMIAIDANPVSPEESHTLQIGVPKGEWTSVSHIEYEMSACVADLPLLKVADSLEILRDGVSLASQFALRTAVICTYCHKRTFPENLMPDENYCMSCATKYFGVNF